MRACFGKTTTKPLIITGGPGTTRPTGGLGFLVCAPDHDFSDALRGMSAGNALPFLGGTSIADPLDASGSSFEKKTSRLDKKNLCYAMGVSSRLNQEHGKRQIRELHARCLEALGKAPAVYFVMLPIMPYLFTDSILGELFGLAGNVPVFGGLVSDEFAFSTHAIFANGERYQDRIVLLALAGDIRPTLSLGCQVTVPYEFSPKITCSRGNIIERVDDMSFCEYLTRLGYEPSKLNGYPISVRVFSEETADFIDTNALVELDLEKGSGTFIRNFPRDASLTICFLSREDIVASTASCIDDLVAKMAREEATGYRYDTLLCVSCVARHYAMTATDRIEARMMAERLPGHLNAMGYYSFGEVSPVYRADGGFSNRTHGHVLTLCAF